MSRRGNPCEAQHRIAEALGKILGAYVDPWDVEVYPARGYWAHNHQDAQRWTGSAKTVDGGLYTIGSWYLTLAEIRKGKKFEVTDNRQRSSGGGDNVFQFEPL